MIDEKMTNQEFRIIWAIDARADFKLQKSAISSIKALLSVKPATVEPVYFLSTFLDSTPSQSAGETLSLTEEAIQNHFKALVRRYKIPKLQPLTVLNGTDLSMRRMTAELNEYAKTRGASIIVLASHRRKGIKKWFLGSFSESMLHQPSHIPLLITHSHGKQASFDHFLFPTDFSDASKEAYRRVIEFSVAARSRITLFHRISLPVSPELNLMMTDSPDYKRIRLRAIADAHTQATSMAIVGVHRGLKVKISIDAQGMTSVADAILKHQKRSGGIIALAFHTSNTPSLMGNTTRTVIRGSSSAVWVLTQEGEIPVRRIRGAA
jgi:nucleotide-binding universal stress UspA family protein